MERTLHNSVNQNEVCVGHFAKKAVRLYSVDGVFGALRRDKSWHCENDYAANASKTHRSKGQLISKAIYGLLTSPKKRTDEFVLFAFLLFMANKSNSSVRFLGKSKARQSAFWFYLTFSCLILSAKNIKLCNTLKVVF